MFEFHGWATIQANDSDDPSVDELAARELELHSRVEGAIRAVEAVNRAFHLYRFNGTMHLIFCGAHNHRSEAVIEFFHDLSALAPDVYGKLHVRDDEDAQGFENVMREWTLAGGRVVEATDERMSPCIPSLESEYNQANKAQMATPRKPSD